LSLDSTAIASTAGLLLYRIAKAQGEFLGRIRAYGIDGYADPRNVFVPLNHNDGSNPRIPVEAPIPGVFIYRVKESVLYPNVNHYTDELVAYIFAHTKRTNPQSYPRLGDRPWNVCFLFLSSL
jgi:sodium-independent sulfate anion transporter 11